DLPGISLTERFVQILQQPLFLFRRKGLFIHLRGEPQRKSLFLITGQLQHRVLNFGQTAHAFKVVVCACSGNIYRAALAAATKALASRVISAQSAFCKAALGTNEEPAPAATQPALKNGPMVFRSTPPVGTICRCGRGARRALM